MATTKTKAAGPPDVLAAIEARERADRDQATAAFRELARRLADDPSDAGAEEAADVLASAGKTAADLRTAIDTFQKRRALAEQVADGRRAAGELSVLASKAVNARLRYDAARVEMEAVEGEVAGLSAAPRVRAEAGQRAAAELVRTADPWLRDRLARVEAEVGRARDSLAPIHGRLDQLRREAAARDATWGDGTTGPLAQTVAARRELPEAEAELKAALAERDRLVAEADAIRAEMANP